MRSKERQMTTTKIDKKVLEEPDRLQLFFLNIREFVEKHKSKIYAGAGIFTLIVLLAGGWYLYQLNYEANAEKTYARILDTAMKTLSPAGDPAAINGYKDLITRYSRSQAAITAYYRLGNLYFDRHELDSAILAYRDFLLKAPVDSDLVTLAYNNLGSCYEIKKDFNKAIEVYELALKSKTSSSFEAINYGGIARIYEKMNNPAKATEFYQKALGKMKDPLMTLYLKRKISLLG
jgi:tetratricopeptide (TPR) repeat protein